MGASAQDRTGERRAELRTAFAAADSGQLDPAQALAHFGHDPLYPWLQALALRKQIGAVAAEPMQAALAGMGEQPAASWLRAAWLSELVKREDWRAFRTVYRGGGDLDLRCADLRARMETDTAPEQDAAWVADARKAWLSGGALPARCDAPMARLERLGKLDDALRWQRIDLAIEAGNAALLRAIAKGMDGGAARLAESYAAFLAAPGAIAPDWPQNARSRNLVGTALGRLAKRDPDRAQQLLAQLPQGERAGVAYQVALWSVASYLPSSAERLNAVPAAAYDERLREWQTREAISRGDDAAALAAISNMTTAQRDDTRWQYFEARLRERGGQSGAARLLYEKAAQGSGFHAWLAADRLHQPYVLCALEPVADPALARRVAGDAALGRALDLFALDRADLAAREWSGAIKPMSDDERRLAVREAVAEGWFDRAVSGMILTPEDQRYYSLRFPLHHEAELRAQSQRNGLDPAWVAAQTRAESSFMPKARSGADARGLMQLLPGTGALTAQRLGLAWQGGDSLYDPITNLRLGTAYLRQMLDRFGGAPYLAIAAYNAGPRAVERWRAARPQLDPDFFIETIPYKETRDYVTRVLGFSVIYDWRLNASAAPLEQRMTGRPADEPGGRKPFSCPAKNVAAP
ncbi:soluble lytic murein transglycosylase [Oxalobacteraceae bacterium GrIS 1.11]